MNTLEQSCFLYKQKSAIKIDYSIIKKELKKLDYPNEDIKVILNYFLIVLKDNELTCPNSTKLINFLDRIIKGFGYTNFKLDLANGTLKNVLTFIKVRIPLLEYDYLIQQSIPFLIKMSSGFSLQKDRIIIETLFFEIIEKIITK